jgi:hypothetical protein
MTETEVTRPVRYLPDIQHAHRIPYPVNILPWRKANAAELAALEATLHALTRKEANPVTESYPAWPEAEHTCELARIPAAARHAEAAPGPDAARWGPGLEAEADTGRAPASISDEQLAQEKIAVLWADEEELNRKLEASTEIVGETEAEAEHS